MPATKLDKVLARMTDMEHQSIEKDFFGQIYGPTGGGKTILVAQLAQRLTETGKIFWVDSSDGWVSLEDKPELRKGMTHFPYEDIGELTAIADAIKTRKKGFADFDVVVLDECTSIYSSVLDTVQRERLGTPDNEIPSETPDWTDYFPAGQIVFRMVDAFHSIPGVHVILVGHDQQKKDHRNVERTMPDYSPKLNGLINKPLHLSAHVSAEIKKVAGGEVKYIRSVQSQPTALVEAKSRISGLGLKDSPAKFIDVIEDWVYGGGMAEDLSKDPVDENLDLPEDELPDDGIPVAEGEEGTLYVEEN